MLRILFKNSSLPSSGERINKVKENGKLNKEENATKGMDNTSNKTSGDNPKVIEELEEPVIDGKRVGSGEKIDKVKLIWGRDEKGKPIIVKSFLMSLRNMAFLRLLIITQDLLMNFH